MATTSSSSADPTGTLAKHHIDPELRPILAHMLARIAARPPLGTSTAMEMRARFTEDVTSWNADPPALSCIEDRIVLTTVRAVPVRVYSTSPRSEPQPAIVFFHGGGWVVGDLDSNERALRVLAIDSGVTVISVDYCLAPENPFPAPLDECVAVARWIRRHSASWGIDVDRLAFGGESAGANLALAAALDLRDAGENWLRHLLLIYGAYARDNDTESHRLFGDGSMGFGTQAMDTLWSMYLGGCARADNPRAAPLRAALGGLPPAYLVAGGLDPLRDDSRRLAARLIEAGGSIEYHEYPGVVHGFMSMTRDLTVARRAMAHAGDSLRRGLSPCAPPAPDS